MAQQQKGKSAVKPAPAATSEPWEDDPVDRMPGTDLVPEGAGRGVMMTRTDPALVEAELRTLASIAMLRKRDWKEVLTTSLEELEMSHGLDPGRWDDNKGEYVDGFADSMYYVIDYGGGEKPVTGLSIGAALLMARQSGGMLVTARIVGETDDYIDAEGVAFDLQKMFVVRRTRRESKWQRRRKTQRMEKIREDLIPQVAGRAQSKGLRNAILAIIPESVQAVFWKRAKELVAGAGRGGKRPPIEKAIPKALEWLAERGVTRAMFEARFKKKVEEITPMDWAEIRGVLGAIYAGESSIERTFGVRPQTQEEVVDADPTAGADVE